MRKTIRKIWNAHWQKGMATFFAGIMILQFLCTPLDVIAYEMGKIKLAPTTGEYYNKDLSTNDLSLNKGMNDTSISTLSKEPTMDVEDNEYDESQEIKEKRTSNSKTYKLSNGTYVTDTYFEPIHKKEKDKFVEIDNTLENVSKARSNPIYENKDGIYSFKVQDNTMSMENEKGLSLKVVNDSAKLDTYNVKENVILYSEAYENIDMEYRLKGNAVTTNFFINASTSCKEISYTIEKGKLKVQETLDALLFLDENEKVVFSYSKPTITDGQGKVDGVVFQQEEKEDKVRITLSMDENWIHDAQRIFPLKMSARAADEYEEIDVDTSYNRSANPNQNSNYYQLFVGYEDGSLSGGTFFGVSRTYVHVSGMNLGPEKLILGAKLKLYKLISEPQQWNTISIGKTAGYVKPSEATWNNKPGVTEISTTNVRTDPGWQEFDVKSYIEDIYNGRNNTIELKATNESSTFTPNIFSSESGVGLPKISVTYRDAFDVNPNLPIDIFDTEMRPFSILNKGFEAISFDGIARPEAQVIFDLVERGKDEVIKSHTSKGVANKYFVNPIYITNYLANTQKYAKSDVNYTTDYIYKDTLPEFDTPYEYKVKVQAPGLNSVKEFRTDSLIKYKVKSGDNLKNIASYYGVTIDELKADNNLTTNIIKEDDVLIVRFKKNNDKVSKDVYTPPVRTIEYKAKYVNRGPRCASGMCTIIDPVNATTGNYYYEGTDFTIKDAEDFDFIRYYNSTGPQVSNMFGNGFTSPIESYISYDKKGNILYFTGDGKIFEIEKTSTGYKARSQDKMDVDLNGEKVTIFDKELEKTYQFDVYGYLESITTKEGVVTSIVYDEYGLITAVKVGEKTLTFSYNENKLVKDITLPTGNKVSYKYEKRNLVEYTDTKGESKKYTYDENNFLTSIVDKNKSVITQNTYDDEGRVVKQIDGNKNVSTLSYEEKETVITNADHSKDVYTFNDEYDVVSVTQDGVLTTKNTYDKNRNLTSSTDEDGNVTKYDYDNNENVISIEYPDKAVEEFKYDVNNNIIYQKDRDGSISENAYINNDLIATSNNKKENNNYEYDNKRRVVKEINQFGVFKSYTYANNMVSSITHSNGLVETFDYDANGFVTKEGDNQGKIITYLYNANNEMTQKNYYDGSNEQWTYDANGNISSYKDRIGGITTNTYDKNNNLISSKKGNLSTSNTYDEMNRLIKEVDEQGLSKSYTYDKYGNKETESDIYGNVTEYEYDVDGNVVKTTNPFGNEEKNIYKDGILIESITKEGLSTTYEYDELNREIKKINPNGSEEIKEYEGLLLKREIDGKGTIIEHQYDGFNREVKTITTYTDNEVSTTTTTYDSYGNIVETNTDGVVERNTYDVYNQLVSSTDALGNITSKQYDFDGNVVKEVDALGNQVITKYDGNNNVISITDKNGNVETKTYNPLGQLISETDPLGYVKTYSYNNKGQVVQAMDPYNTKIKYKYDEFGNQIEVELEGKVIEKKEFDSYGREIYTQDAKKRTTTAYDEFDRKVEVTDELIGLTTYYAYDEYGNVTEEKDGEGLFTTFEYDKYQRKIKSIDAYGREEVITYNVRDNIVATELFDGTKTTSKYDIRGNVIESKDALNKVTKNTYDLLNRLVKEEAGKKITENVYDGNGQIVEVKNMNNNTVSKTIYDPNGNVIEGIDVLGNSTKTEYDAKNQVITTIDAKGNKTIKQYDAYGNVVKETNALGFSKQTKYNQYGLKELEVDERGFDTTYEYNEDFQLEKVIDANGNELAISYNDQLQKIKEVDPGNGVTEYSYDEYGREEQVIAPNGKVTTKEYDALGNTIKEVSGRKTTSNKYDDLGRLANTSINGVSQTTNKYNKYNQIIESKDANQNVSTFKYDENNNCVYANEKGSISEKEYDVYGNVIKQIDNKTYITENNYDAKNQLLSTKINGKTSVEKQYDANGNEIKSIENGAEVRKKYNEINSIISAEIPSSKTDEFVAIQTIEYDEGGNPLKITDANGSVEIKKYDANNNVIEETNKNGIETLYEYDGLNNLLKVQNHKDRYVSYTYDKSNNVTFKKINDNYAEYKYDENSNLVYEEDENKYITKYEYDVFDRKVNEVKPDGSNIHYTYDNLGNKIAENNKKFTYDSRNNVLTATNKEGSVKNTYDAFNNKISIKDTNGNVVKYRFNEDNRLSRKDYAGIQVNYTYNDNGLLETIKKGNQQIAKYEYNNRNEVVKLTQKQTITQKTYDDMGRVLTQVSSKDGTNIFDAKYTYDANDNLIKEVIDGKENTYAYDGYDELKESHKYINNKLVTTTYKNDVFGNRMESSSSEGKKTYKYNERNQVESVETKDGIIKYNYDSNGNVSKKVNEDGRVDLYKYDEFNQLVQLDQDRFVYDYKYDAENERIQQIKTDTKDYHYDKWYDYSESLELVEDKEVDDVFKNLQEQVKKKKENNDVCDKIVSDTYDVTYFKESEVTEYTLDRNKEYTQILKSNDTINVYGDTLLETDKETIVTAKNESVVAKVASENIKKISYSDYGFTKDIQFGNGYNGEMLDQTGLIYLRARYYDPSVSRFIQIDTNYKGEKESVASQNKYAYTMNNPYKYVDRNGN